MREAAPLNLGGLIDFLETLEPDTEIPLGLHIDSYRGYYDHVYIEEGQSTARDLAAYLNSQCGEVMYGYKGGDFTIRTNCLVFVASYGDTGPLLGLLDGELITIEEVWT